MHFPCSKLAVLEANPRSVYLAAAVNIRLTLAKPVGRKIVPREPARVELCSNLRGMRQKATTSDEPPTCNTKENRLFEREWHNLLLPLPRRHGQRLVLVRSQNFGKTSTLVAADVARTIVNDTADQIVFRFTINHASPRNSRVVS